MHSIRRSCPTVVFTSQIDTSFLLQDMSSSGCVPDPASRTRAGALGRTERQSSAGRPASPAISLKSFASFYMASSASLALLLLTRITSMIKWNFWPKDSAAFYTSLASGPVGSPLGPCPNPKHQSMSLKRFYSRPFVLNQTVLL